MWHKASANAWELIISHEISLACSNSYKMEIVTSDDAAIVQNLAR